MLSVTAITTYLRKHDAAKAVCDGRVDARQVKGHLGLGTGQAKHHRQQIILSQTRAPDQMSHLCPPSNNCQPAFVQEKPKCNTATDPGVSLPLEDDDTHVLVQAFAEWPPKLSHLAGARGFVLFMHGLVVNTIGTYSSHYVAFEVLATAAPLVLACQLATTT